MSPRELLAFLRRHRLAVQASTDADGRPQAAVVGFVVSDAFELLFDTLGSTRKAQNLRRDPHCAVVVGWDDEQTVQLEGVADEPRAVELVRLQQLYFAAFPDGRERQHWPGITWFRVRPTWARCSDFRGSAPRIVEFDAAALQARVD